MNTVPPTAESILTNVFGSKEKSVEEVVATLYWLILLKISSVHELHQKMSTVDSSQIQMPSLPHYQVSPEDCDQLRHIPPISHKHKNLLSLTRPSPFQLHNRGWHARLYRSMHTLTVLSGSTNAYTW